MFKIYRKSGNDLFEFTDLCEKITLRSSESEISEQLSFDIKGKFLAESNIILLYEDSKKVFEGIIISISISEYTSTINCFDFGWYLNKNEDIYQFNNNVSECITKILNDYQIPIGNIANISVLYKDINRGTLSQLISNLMEYATKNNGIKYIWQMRENKFYLEQEKDNVVIYNSNLFGENTDITKLMKNPSIKKSIENLKNAIKVVDQEENSINVLGYKEDTASIAKYGKIQKLEYLSKDEKGTALNIAENQLKLFNKTETTLQVELPGNIECRANKILQFDDDIIGAKGKFKIKQCTHTMGIVSHTMSLELELI